MKYTHHILFLLTIYVLQERFHYFIQVDEYDSQQLQQLVANLQCSMPTMLFFTRSHNSEVVQHLNQVLHQIIFHFPIVQERVPQFLHNGGKWKMTWFDGKPQLYISIFWSRTCLSVALFMSDTPSNVTEIRVWKIKDLQQLVST